jgi:hypothetical protein
MQEEALKKILCDDAHAAQLDVRDRACMKVCTEAKRRATCHAAPVYVFTHVCV